MIVITGASDGLGLQVARQDKLIIGSGIRGSKLLVDGAIFNDLANTTVMDLAQ